MDQVISGRAVSNKVMEEKVESQRGQQARMSGNISNFFLVAANTRDFKNAYGKL